MGKEELHELLTSSEEKNEKYEKAIRLISEALESADDIEQLEDVVAEIKYTLEELKREV